MNFAGKKLNNYYQDPKKLSSREKKLIAENNRLKKRNKRLSTAMVYLVGQVEKRLPLLAPKSEKASSAPPPLQNTSPSAKPQKNQPPKKAPQKQKIVGEAWEPEKLTSTKTGKPTERKRKPLSEILESTTYKVDISEVNFKPEPEKRIPLYERVQHEYEAEQEDETPVTETVETTNTPDVIEDAPLVAEDMEHTPELDSKEMNLLASPTWDKKQDVFHPQPSELVTERSSKKTSAQEAADAYRAVAVSSQPVPDAKISDGGTIEDAETEEKALADQLAQQQDVLREAMLRRVNRLRW
ncbi:hypothetical protein [Sneathiella limimaris]|uniref:hypothetical protein n=1 Tax=Sneathiella limimaris TaxID=1964213 RepID=UPI00146F16C9|nr:hypothetical protein [Sneathiella limimaris]